MKKKLNTDAIKNELEGSVFFPTRPPEPGQQEKVSSPAPRELEPMLPNRTSHISTESNQSRLQDSTVASKLASTLAAQPDIIETIRKIVKTPAKEEVLYIRVTKEEKKQLGDIEYTYDRQDIETSANELGRIAVNFLIADYKANGEQSILAKVLTALHA